MALYTEDLITEIDEMESGWSNPNSLNLQYVIDQFNYQTIQSYRYPFDYKFVFSFTFDDSSNYLDQIFGTIAPLVNPNLNFRIYQKQKQIGKEFNLLFRTKSNKKRYVIQW